MGFFISIIIHIFATMNDKLKNIILKKLYEDLSHVEIIPYDDSIWFIDRDKKYWYLQYKSTGYLYWSWSFFTNFFYLFSIDRYEYELILVEFVEKVLNRKASMSIVFGELKELWVKDILNCKIHKTTSLMESSTELVELVLKYKGASPSNIVSAERIEEVLNHKIHTTIKWDNKRELQVKEILNSK